MAEYPRESGESALKNMMSSVSDDLKMFDLKVTTACSVVRLPSSQPFGRTPGEPQLISKQSTFIEREGGQPGYNGVIREYWWRGLGLD